ncbi:ribonuclease H-like domain-containing protein [Tanacetum coccineum]
MPLKPNLVLADEEEYAFSESITSVPAVATSKVKTSESKPKSVSEPLIEDWISDSEDENETEESVEKVENNKQAKHPRKNSQSPRVSDNKGNEANAVKASACWVWRPKQKVLDHVSRHKGASMNFKRFDYVDALGRSKHMTGNKSYLSYYEEIDGGFIAFGGDPKGGKITSKGKISTDTECVVLSHDFKLLDENHVLLRVPRKDNMYSVDLKNIVPSGGLTFLFAKATLDESNLWHRRLGHINFKTINKLVKGNLAEAVNTACYVQNRVLVIKPHNKTPYELFLVEENLHVKFSEETPNIARNGPNWLFDIDALTKSMNYEPVVAGNQSNGIAGTKACDNVGKARVETIPGKDYILLPFLTQDPPYSSSLKDSPDAGFKPSGEEEMKDVEHLENEDKDNAVDENIVYGCIDDPNIPNLEEIVYSKDDEGVGVEPDMNNLDTFMPVSPIPTTRIHKDHPLEQIIGDIHLAPQTRRMTKSVTEHVEPSRGVIQALTDPCWNKCNADELLQFKLQKVEDFS